MDFRDAFHAALARSRAAVFPRQVSVLLLDSRPWRRWLEQARALLDVEEQARVDRRRNPMDREQLTLAYAMHRLFLADLWACPPSQVPLGRDALGCPTLAGQAAVTSLSHSEYYVALAYSRCGPVGVDVEPISRAAVMEEIAAHICHPDELCLPQMQSDGRAEFLLELWVRKESLLKAAGIGLAVEMNAFPVLETEDLYMPGSNAEGNRSKMSVQLLPLGSDVRVAVATVQGCRVDSQCLFH